MAAQVVGSVQAGRGPGLSACCECRQAPALFRGGQGLWGAAIGSSGRRYPSVPREGHCQSKINTGGLPRGLYLGGTGWPMAPARLGTGCKTMAGIYDGVSRGRDREGGSIPPDLGRTATVAGLLQRLPGSNGCDQADCIVADACCRLRGGPSGSPPPRAHRASPG